MAGRFFIIVTILHYEKTVYPTVKFTQDICRVILNLFLPNFVAV